MSVSSTERLNRQLKDAQSEEFEDWLKTSGSKHLGDSLDGESVEELGEKESGQESVVSLDKSENDYDSKNPSENGDGPIRGDLWTLGCRKFSIQPGITSPWKYSPASELEERKILLSQLDYEIEMGVKRSKNKMKVVNKGWDKLGAKQKSLVQAIRKLDILIQDCREKRHEMRRTFRLETVQTRKYTKLVNEYNQQLKALNNLMLTIERRVDNHFLFESLLREVKEQSDGRLTSVRDVINRAYILQSIRRRLMQSADDDQEEYRSSMQDLVRINDRSRRNIWKLSGTLADVCKRNEEMSDELKVVERKLEVEKTSKQKENMVFGQLQLAVSNLQIQLSRQLQLKPKTIPLSEPQEQFKSIEKLLDQLRYLCEGIRKNSVAKSDEVAIEVDTQALEKLRLRYKMY